MNDEITIANRTHWEAEVVRKNGFTVPWLNLDRDNILKYAEDRLDPVPSDLYQIYPAYLLKDVVDKDVLCLAAGGGQQSAVFGLLDANVTVIDFTQGQLDGDIAAAKHYGYQVETHRLNIRDLSEIEDASYDLVYQGPSMSWVPSVHEIYRSVSRIIRPGGRYRVDFGNPANHFWEWDGEYYRVTEPYSERVFRYPDGAFDFRHYLSDIFNGLVDNGFRIERVEERSWTQPDIEATPGSWTHEMAYNVSFAVVAEKERDIGLKGEGFTVEALNIRKAHADDSEFVFTVKKAAYREYVEQVWGWDDKYQRERHNKEFASHDFHIIQFRETDVGFFITSSTSGTLKVNQIFILPEYQGRGIGSACMTRIIDNANLEQRSVVLQVLKVNTRGIALYQRLGFTIVGQDSIYFQMEKLPE